MAALLDVYTALSDASKAQQNLQLLPWERLKLRNGLLEDLRSKHLSLPRARRPGEVSSAQIQELLAEKDPEDAPTYWPNLARHLQDMSQSQVCALLIKLVLFLLELRSLQTSPVFVKCWMEVHLKANVIIP